MKLSAFLKRWPAACLALAVGLSGCAGGVNLTRREAAGEVQIESVRWQSGALPLQLVSGPCGRGLCDRRRACEACGGDGCAIIIPPWLAATHEDTAAELEGGCVARLPWRGVGTCDRPCGPCGVRGGHYAASTGPEYVDLAAVDPPAKASPKQAAQSAKPKSKWLDLFTQRRQGVSRPAPTRYTPPAMPVMPLNGPEPMEEDREPLVTQSEPPAESRSRVNDTSLYELEDAGGEIVQTKAETKAPPAKSETPATNPPAPNKGASKILLPSQIAASAAATRPTVRAAQIPVVRPAVEPPRGENPFETRRAAPQSAPVVAGPANNQQRVTTDLVNVDEQAPRSPSARTVAVPANGDRTQKTEPLPPLRTAAPTKLPPPPTARPVVADAMEPRPAEPKPAAPAVRPTPDVKPSLEKEPAPQIAEQPAPKPEARPEPRPTVRVTVERPEPQVAEAKVPTARPAPTAPVIGPPVAATPTATRSETPANLVPAYVPNPPKAEPARHASPAPAAEIAVARPAASPEHVVAVGTLQKPEARKIVSKPSSPAPAPAGASERYPARHAPSLPPVVMTQRPPEVEVIPVRAPEPAPPPPPVEPAPTQAAPIVIELPRPGERFASLDALMLVAEHRYASVRTYRAKVVQLRAGSPLPVRASLHFRYRKSPQAIIAGTSADPMHGRQAQWAEGADEWTVVAPVAAGRIKLSLKLDEERPLGENSRPLIECGLGPLLDQLAVNRAAAAGGEGRLEYRGPVQRPEFEQPVHEVVYRTPVESVHYFFDAKSFLPVLYELREGESILVYELYDGLEVNVPELDGPLAFDADHQFGL